MANITRYILQKKIYEYTNVNGFICYCIVYTEYFTGDDIDMLIECTALPPGAKAEDYEHMLEVHEQLKKLKEAV